MNYLKYLPLCLFFISLGSCSTQTTYYLEDYGLVPNSKQNASPLMVAALKEIASSATHKKPIRIVLSKGTYYFHPEGAFLKDYFISNHDQFNPKSIGLVLENMQDVTFDGQGSELIFQGRMLPIALIHSKNCRLENFSIDYINPHVTQAEVIANDTLAETLTFKLAPWVNYEIRNHSLVVKGENWEHTPTGGVAFEEKTKRMVYATSDIPMMTQNVVELEPGVVKSLKWKNEKLIPGTRLIMSGPRRPTPGIFLSHDTCSYLKNIKIHYAEGIGLLAQISKHITLDRFSICFRDSIDPRYFTTKADATHFSGCSGVIISKDGLYENMLDDAINVHGIYLKIQKRIDNHTLICRYSYPQTYGFDWGFSGDTIRFIESKTMEYRDEMNRISSIRPVINEGEKGYKEFQISFEDELDPEINEEGLWGIENITQTPEVFFTSNTIRNNRARGALFSTPRKTIIENNLFDHTSGAAILLCGDCNGWYESGACRDVLIRKNRFVNSLTNLFEFTNAIISIYPEIPHLENQKKYFHSGIVIENNEFDTFDKPILYAKSVDGLVFHHNRIKQNQDYPAFHWNQHHFFFQRVIHSKIQNNQFEGEINGENDLLLQE